ncbi:hypothetical protein [Streptomyces sp. NPDC087307]|uniref:hypothetical protein n=1 Tax=Streptomyces sp. NPDC087307 TaxID=3365782 RepID=UPI0037F19D2F
MNVALVASNQEVEELRERPRLALDRAVGEPFGLALVREEPVGVLRTTRPYRPAEEAHVLEDRPPVVGDRTVRHPSADPCEQELVDQLLLEVLVLLCRRQSPRRTDRPDDRERHRRLSSLRTTMRHK